MKKIVFLLSLLLPVLLGIGNVSTVSAYVYPQDLNGDPNYILTYGHMNYGTYIDKRSVKVVSQDATGIIFTVNTVSGLVLGHGDDWIVPAQNIKTGNMMIMRVYDDPWMVVYTYDNQNGSWTERDLSNTFGYNQTFLGIFAESWKILTGSDYPNLTR